MKFFIFSLVVVLLPLITTTKISSKLSPSLSSSLQTASENSVWNIVVEMEDGVESVFQKTFAITKLTDFTRDEKASLLGQELAAHASTSQKGVLTLLAQNKGKRKSGADPPEIWSSWISNSVFVRGADKELILSLEGAPGVAVITEELVIALEVLKEEPVVCILFNENVYHLHIQQYIYLFKAYFKIRTLSPTNGASRKSAPPFSGRIKAILEKVLIY